MICIAIVERNSGWSLDTAGKTHTGFIGIIKGKRYYCVDYGCYDYVTGQEVLVQIDGPSRAIVCSKKVWTI